MEKGRKLKVLVVHDTHFNEDTNRIVLGTEDLTLSQLVFGTGRVSYVLRNWVEVINVLGGLTRVDDEQGASVEVPDLMLVDCHFNLDPNSPKFINEDDARIDPRGLLYGAVLAAHFLGANPRRPFAFLAYSEDMSSAARDPYAQTFYSLLSAMVDPAPETVEASHYSRAMAETPASQTPDQVVSLALERFRRSLLEALTSPLFYPETDSFERALTAADAFLKGSQLHDDLALSWTDARGVKESVLLRSLFADCRQSHRWIKDEEQRVELGAWGSVEGQGMLDFLRTIADGRNYYKDVLYPTINILKALEQSREPQDWGEGLEKEQRRALAFAIAWAKDRCKAKWENSKKLKGVTYLEPQVGDSTQINRALGAVLGPSGKAKEPRRQGREVLQVLDGAEEWPFPEPSWLPRLLVKYLKDIYAEEVRRHGKPLNVPYLDQKYWPRCLKP